MAKLIGTKPDQVPTNADLGTMAYQDKDNLNVTKLKINDVIESDYTSYFKKLTGTITSGDGTVPMFSLALGNYTGYGALIEMFASCKSGNGGVRFEYKRSIWYENGGLTMTENSIDSVDGSNMVASFTTSGTTLYGNLSTSVSVTETFSFWFRITGNIAKDSVTVLYT